MTANEYFMLKIERPDLRLPGLFELSQHWPHCFEKVKTSTAEEIIALRTARILESDDCQRQDIMRDARGWSFRRKFTMI